jgi:hypothetical protein
VVPNALPSHQTRQGLLKERPPEPQVRRKPGETRCPFCHEECLSTENVCACVECLARHHAACWAEGGSCSSCGASQALVSEDVATTSQELREVVDGWLKRGAAYNAPLAALSLLYVSIESRTAEFWPIMLLIAALANLGFLVWPAIELGVRRLGYRPRWLRWYLSFPAFVLGLGFFVVTFFAFLAFQTLH